MVARLRSDIADPPIVREMRVLSMRMETTVRAKKQDEQPMYVRLPRELHEAVKERSAADERTMAQTIRHALRFYLQQTEPIAR